VYKRQVAWRHIAAVRAAARARLAPQFAEVLEKTAMPFVQPIYDLAAPQLAHGRVALLGDAAFVARPHVGMGVAKAAADALVLQQAIAEFGATPQALRHYERLRHPAGLAVVERARLLGAGLEAPQPGDVPTPRHAPDVVMRQTAIDPSLFATCPP
jgi:2-polyprenyl-6-methoxyphenol hydroxylase-like FAD-dependent oxidoreductase